MQLVSFVLDGLCFFILGGVRTRQFVQLLGCVLDGLCFVSWEGSGHLIECSD